MKIKNQVQRFLLILSVAFTIFSCDEDKEVIEKLPTIVEIAKADPANFSLLVAALRKTGLEVTLTNPGSYTVFAPTNAAFTAAGYTSDVIDALDGPGVNNLRLILQNHVLGVGTRADDLVAFGYSRTFALFRPGANLNLFVNKSGNDYLINGGATNNGAKITTSDIDASNGVVHVIDAVLRLPTIVNHLVANPNLFSTLVSVVSSTAGGTYGDQTTVINALTGATNTSALTVFAPTNEAFTAATSTGGYLTGLIVTPENITKILQYHVSRGNLTSSSWGNTDLTVTTLATPQTFRIARGTVRLTELPALPSVPASNITTVNIQAANGVIHAIDRVLQPVL